MGLDRRRMTRMRHFTIARSPVTALKILLCVSSPPSPQNLATADLLTVSIVWGLFTLHYLCLLNLDHGDDYIYYTHPKKKKKKFKQHIQLFWAHIQSVI